MKKTGDCGDKECYKARPSLVVSRCKREVETRRGSSVSVIRKIDEKLGKNEYKKDRGELL